PKRFELPPDHVAFYRSLRLHHLEGDYLFVHAGIGREWLDESDPAYVLRRAHVEDLLWDRLSLGLPPRLGVTRGHGHHPAPGVEGLGGGLARAVQHRDRHGGRVRGKAHRAAPPRRDADPGLAPREGVRGVALRRPRR